MFQQQLFILEKQCLKVAGVYPLTVSQFLPTYMKKITAMGKG